MHKQHGNNMQPVDSSDLAELQMHLPHTILCNGVMSGTLENIYINGGSFTDSEREREEDKGRSLCLPSQKGTFREKMVIPCI